MKIVISILFLFLLNLLVCEANLHTNYSTYNHFSNFENIFSWRHNLQNDLTIHFNTRNSYSDNTHFDRSSKNNNYNYSLTYTKYDIQPFLLANYASFYNTGTPDDSISVSDKYIREGGLGYMASFFKNRLTLQQSGSYVSLDNSLKSYYGFSTNSVVSYQDYISRFNFNSNLYYSDNDTYLETNNAYGATLALNSREILFNNKDNFLRVRIKYDHYAMDTYLFNVRDDRSERDEFLSVLDFSYHISPRFNFSVENISNYRRLNFTENTSRNNWYFDNNFIYELNYKYILGQYYARLNMQNSTRYFRSNNQSRDSLEKQFTIGGLWNFAVVDSLRFEVSNSLQQNFHSGTFNSLDNDRLMTTYTLLTNTSFHRNIFKNSFQYFQGKQIYIDKALSANNHEIYNYQWVPESEFYINHNFRFYNKYTLRAYYDRFIWSEFLNDRFYRYLSGEWGIRFIDQYQNPNNRKTGLLYDRFTVYTAFIIEHTETAENIDDQWYRNNIDYIRNYLLSIEYYKNNFFIRMMPLFKYYNKSIESEIQTDLNLVLGDLLINASVNPIGRQFNTMIWRFNVNLQYNF